MVNALRLLVLWLIAGLSACAVGPNYRTPKPDAPPAFAAKVAQCAGLRAPSPRLPLRIWQPGGER